ncbi:hypothetical protein ACFL6M_07250 [Candidatus Eisenbacteria bacterium]|uniref:Uncharacterized protein n=1 Tax=Eiseniibacteriota bacterium TaxID=2212470 RepID=A0ABV6YM39_UNCEI
MDQGAGSSQGRQSATEVRWIATAKKTSRRDLEQRVVVARQRAAARRKEDPLQGKLETTQVSPAPEKRCGNQTGKDGPSVDDCLAEEVMLAGLDSLLESVVGSSGCCEDSTIDETLYRP